MAALVGQTTPGVQERRGEAIVMVREGAGWDLVAGHGQKKGVRGPSPPLTYGT